MIINFVMGCRFNGDFWVMKLCMKGGVSNSRRSSLDSAGGGEATGGGRNGRGGEGEVKGGGGALKEEGSGIEGTSGLFRSRVRAQPDFSTRTRDANFGYPTSPAAHAYTFE